MFQNLVCDNLRFLSEVRTTPNRIKKVAAGEQIAVKMGTYDTQQV
jgi:hypothetical protein